MAVDAWFGLHQRLGPESQIPYRDLAARKRSVDKVFVFRCENRSVDCLRAGEDFHAFLCVLGVL